MANHHSNRERGAATVEMAIVTIFLFIMVAGIVDIGRALYTFIGVQEAAQEGAIYRSFDPDAPDIITRIQDAIEFPDLTDASRSSIDVRCSGDQVEVEVTHRVDLITPIVGQWFGGQINLSRTVTGQVFLGGCVPAQYP